MTDNIAQWLVSPSVAHRLNSPVWRAPVYDRFCLNATKLGSGMRFGGDRRVVVEQVTDGFGRCAPDLNRWKADIAAFQPLVYDQYLP